VFHYIITFWLIIKGYKGAQVPGFVHCPTVDELQEITGVRIIIRIVVSFLKLENVSEKNKATNLAVTFRM